MARPPASDWHVASGPRKHRHVQDSSSRGFPSARTTGEALAPVGEGRGREKCLQRERRRGGVLPGSASVFTCFLVWSMSKYSLRPAGRPPSPTSLAAAGPPSERSVADASMAERASLLPKPSSPRDITGMVGLPERAMLAALGLASPRTKERGIPPFQAEAPGIMQHAAPTYRRITLFFIPVEEPLSSSLALVCISIAAFGCRRYHPVYFEAGPASSKRDHTGKGRGGRTIIAMF